MNAAALDFTGGAGRPSSGSGGAPVATVILPQLATVILPQLKPPLTVEQPASEAAEPPRQAPPGPLSPRARLNTIRKLYREGELHIARLGLQELPDFLSNTLTLQLGVLRRVHAPSNRFQQLTSPDRPELSCIHMRKVTEMALGDNRLRTLPVTIASCEALTSLSLERNCLAAVPLALLAVKSLRRLDLRENGITALPDRFGDLTAMEFLDLSGNRLKELPPTLPLLARLKELRLCDNGMAHLGILPVVLRPQGAANVQWRKRYHKEAKREVWVNELTGETSEVDPTDDQAVEAAVQQGSDKIVEGTAVYNRRRNQLADRGIKEWAAAVDEHTGQLEWRNAVTGSVYKAMPAGMDRWQSFGALEVLLLNRNRFRHLPESICSCANLRVLEAQSNVLERLPPDIGRLVKLEKIVLRSNLLSQLPGSMGACTRMTRLDVSSNRFRVFPDFCLELSALRHLILSDNQLKKLPYTVGFVKTLTDLQVAGNPLVDPPAEILLQGMPRLLWECRQRYLRQQRGAPPQVGVRRSGIQDERLELEPEFRKKIEQAVSRAGAVGEFHMTKSGLRGLPEALYAPEVAGKLTSIRIDGSDLSDAPLSFVPALEDPVKVASQGPVFVKLHVLSLKSCRIAELHPSFSQLAQLRYLSLEQNRIEQLPRQIGRLRHLEVLDLRNNHLLELPPEIGRLSKLKTLLADSNRLEEIPPELCDLALLETLTLGENRIEELPAELPKLQGLKALDLVANCVTRLPGGFGALQLVSFKCAFNRLMSLDADAFRPSLGRSLQQLWLQNNNLLELPASFVELRACEDVLLDANPLRNPPATLLSEGHEAVVRYVRIRTERLTQMRLAIRARGFKTSTARLTPKARDAACGKTGYLTLQDLEQFDIAVDRCINCDFYRYPVLPAQLAKRLHMLKARREIEFYEAIVQGVRDQLEHHEHLSAFSSAVYLRSLLRPWGRGGEDVPCYAISLDAFLHDTMPNIFVPEGRVSLWSQTRRKLPPSLFPYSKKVLKKAFRRVVSPYGPTAGFEVVPFESCECVDPLDGRELRHAAGGCDLKALVLVHIVYTREEATRRAAEEKAIAHTLEEVFQEVRRFVFGKIGLGRVKQELKKRRLGYGVRIGQCEIVIQQVRAKLRTKEEVLRFARLRKQQFEAGEPAKHHNLKTADEAVRVVKVAEEEVQKLNKELELQGLLKGDLKHRMTKMTFEQLADEAKQQLGLKYCHLKYMEMMETHRTIAVKEGLRRPWDGANGSAFHEWAYKKGLQAAFKKELPDNKVLYRDLPVGPEGEARPEGREAAEGDESALASKYSWDGTDDMAQYHTPFVVDWFKQGRKVKEHPDLQDNEEGGASDTESSSDGEAGEDDQSGTEDGGGGSSSSDGNSTDSSFS